MVLGCTSMGLGWGLGFSLHATGKIGGRGEARRGDFELDGEEGARAMHLERVGVWAEGRS